LLLLLVSVITPSLAAATNASIVNPGGISKLGLNPAPGSAGLAPHSAALPSFGHTVGFGPSRITIAGPTHALTISFHNAKPVLPQSTNLSHPLPLRERTEVRGTNLRLGQITYRQPWPGVDVVYETGGSEIAKSNYLLAPGFTTTTIQQIVLDYHQPIRINSQGDLVISFSGGEFIESAPIAWQEVEGKRVPVQVSFFA
jgi:hypothetical protein